MAIIITSQQLIAQEKEESPKIPTVEEALKRMANGEKFNMKKVFQHNDPNFSLSGKEDNPYMRLEFDFNRLRDPFTGKIPDEIREKELKYIHSKKSKLQDSFNKNGQLRAVGDITSPWVNRGPYNVGGRTRGIAIDLTDEDIIIAGGVSGGLWRTLDQGANWTRVSELDDNPSITAVVQDPTTTNIWYYATGEWTGISASARNGAATFRGNGVWKSINNGVTWTELSTTTTISPQSYNNVFQYNMNMAISPATGHLYVANSGGIYESQNDGSSFTQVLAANPFTETDVVVDSNGILYAAFDSGAGTNTGVFRSTDGTTWTSITPAGFPASYNRITLGIAPSNEDVVWVFVEATGNANGLDHDLWKFTYDAMDADGDGGTWEDRSANLPALGGSVGDLNTQGGYDMYVKAHPTNEDIVFIGGTNLYRSTDGFTSTVNTDWIGGYSPQNDVSLYTDHHPDNHNLLFFSSNSSTALSSHDGGISITSNILENTGVTEEVDWTLLSNGYLTTQVYALSIGPGDQIMAGFQDNSTWFSNSTSPTATWVDQFSGDGAYNQINSDGTVRYVSAQLGVIARQTYSDANSTTPLTSTRIAPTGASGALFIAPIEMDPNNDEILYFASGSSVWRDTNASTATSDTWSELSNAQASSGSVSSIGISTNPPNTIYFGTTTGNIYRVDNAIAGDPSGTDVFTGKGLPSGNVANIEVDPSDRDHVFVTFSNYSIPSIFETTDGGTTWTDISGNLEENADGSGSGPSVRWIDKVGDDDIYFVGTSTGLYTTQTINGSSTTWTQVEPNSIGNAVVEQIRSRDDGLVVVGTHGNGLFSAEFEVADITPVITVNQEITDRDVAENGSDVVIDISNVFATTGSSFAVEVFDNSNASLVSPSIASNELTLSITPSSTGEALITLRAFDGTNEAYTYFIVTVGGDLFEGQYTMIQLTNSDLSNLFGGNGTTFAANGINIVSLAVVDENTRSFSAVYLEQFGIGNAPRAFQFDLNANGDVVFGSNQTTGLQAGSPLLLGTASTPGAYNENDPSNFTLTLAEDDGASFGGPFDVSFQLFVNEAPTAVAIDNTSIDEGLASGTLVGNISAVDTNPNDIFSFQLGGTDGASFALNGTTLESAEVFDASVKNTYDITITVTDATGEQYVQDLQITVNGEQATCDPPVITSSSAVDANSITLSWGTVSGADEYEVQHRVSGSTGDWSSQTISETSVVIGSLQPSTDYEVQVRSICGGLTSDFSAIEIVTTDDLTCEQVVITNSTPSENSVDLSWNVVASADSYEVQYKISGSADPWSSTSVSETTASITGLAASTTYAIRVRAICSGAPGTFSAVESVTTNAISCEQVVITDSTPSDNSIDLTWNAVASADSYEVQYKISGSADPWISSSTSGTSTTITGLSASTNYVIRVRAICSGVSGTFSAIEGVTTNAISCEQVVITNTTPSENSIDLSWNTVSSAGSYEVQYKISGSSSWTSVFEAGTSTTISGLTAATNYVIRVRAICSGVSGTFSTIESVSTNAISCEQVVISNATPSDNSVDLSWNTVSSASGYEVQYKVSGSSSWTSVFEAGTSTTLSGLSASTNYVIRVRAICSGVSGIFSTIESVTTDAISCEQVVITSSTPSDNSIDLSWNTVSSAGSYEIQYKISGSPSWTSVFEAGTSTTITGLSAATNYVIRIRAVCSGVTGTFSAIESVTTSTISCDQVVITGSTASDNSIDLQWNAVGSASNYEVQYKVSGSASWTSVIEAGTSTTLSGLSASTNYVIRVRAICSGVSGTFSTIESVATDAISCEQVVITGATPSDNSIDLTWNTVGSADEYQIQYKASGTPTWTTISEPTAFTTISSLLSSTTYVIRIRARCSGIPGSFSAIEVVTTTSPATRIADEVNTDQELQSAEDSFEDAALSLEVYPNPSSRSYVTVAFSKKVDLFSIKVLSIDGKVLNQQVDYESATSMRIDTSDLMNGIYFIRLVTSDEIVVKKLLIQK